MQSEKSQIRIVGGGLAGTEAAIRLANGGFSIELFEMRPSRNTEAHKTSKLAELVCSNSFKSLSLSTAPGILKKEMELFQSVTLEAAKKSAVPAGEALAVDREIFSSEITKTIESHPNIQVKREEFIRLDPSDPTPTIIATGPLTSKSLSESIQELSGEKEFYFYDAISPIVHGNSINFQRAFLANRHDKPTRSFEEHVPPETTVGDYINCPMNKEEYENFVAALLTAERVETKNFERTVHFEGCMPIEALADRGKDTLRFGPMRPIGIIDPNTGRRPWAVVQLRPENCEKTMYNMVGFQTKMKYGAQKSAFSLIPGLENAEFLRMGSMHRNAFLCSPNVLEKNLSLKKYPHLFFAGQITGVEGYMESAATGILAAIFMEAHLKNVAPPYPHRLSAFGALLFHLQNTESPSFQPMGINFGLFPAAPSITEDLLTGKKRKVSKVEKRLLVSKQALENTAQFYNQYQLTQSSTPATL